MSGLLRQFLLTDEVDNGPEACHCQACGTVQVKRKDLPETAIPKKGRPALQHHEFNLAQLDSLVFAQRQDAKAVCVSSNFHDPEAIGTVSRRVNGRKSDVRAPACLAA